MDKTQLIEQLRAIGIREGMDLMTHSSLKRIGPVEDGPDVIIDSLLEILGPDGTLMMPTVSGSVTARQPVFHSTYTPSSVGYLTEVFRKRDNVIRSLHPVHSIAALGPKAAFYTVNHLEANTPWSANSPYGKMMRNDAFILFLGVNFECNTCLHALEIEARIPGLHTRGSTTLAVFDSADSFYAVEHHWHAPKKSYYADLEHIVERSKGLDYGRIGTGISRFVNARILRESLLPLFEKTPELGIMRLSDNDFIWE